MLYRSMVQAIVLHNSETWTVKSEDKQKLRVLEMSALYLLKKISGIPRRDRRRSIDILKELGVEKDIAEVLGGS